MLFTFVVLFLTLGFDLAYGQEQKENEKVTVTLDFTGLNYGLKGNDPIKPPILNNGIIVQNVKVNLSGYIHVNSNNIRLSNYYSVGNSGTIDISVPKNDTIKSISITAKKYEESNFTVSYMHNQKEISKEYDEKNPKRPIQVNGIDSDHIILTPQQNERLYLIQITLTITRPKLDATLDEKGENVETTISEIVGENKTLALNRTFMPSQLYTMCLPFDLSKEMIKGIFGSETKVYSYAGYQNGELSFSTVKEDVVLNAGMPFLMRPEYYVEQPTFAGVTVKSTTAQTVGGGEWEFCGTFGSYELAADGTQLFLTAGGTLAKPKAESRKMRGFRCYLQKHTGTVNGSAQLPSVTIDGETNAIKTAEYAAPTSGTTAYSLSGMKLNAGCKTANGGIMIIDGKKFITTNR